MKSLETVFPEHIQEYYRNIFLLQEKHGEHSSKVMETQFLLFTLPLKADIVNIPENLQLVLSICIVILI